MVRLKLSTRYEWFKNRQTNLNSTMVRLKLIDEIEFFLQYLNISIPLWFD